MSVRKYHQITLERDGCQYLPRKAIESFDFSLLWLVTGPKPTCHILNQSDMANLVFSHAHRLPLLAPSAPLCVTNDISLHAEACKFTTNIILLELITGFSCTVNDVQRDTETLFVRTMLERYSCLAHLYCIPPNQMTRGNSEVICTHRNAIR